MAIKVSQATIDKIKKMGMTAALKKAPNANPEMKEALTRMYGARRVAAAGGGKARTVAKSADAARASAMKRTNPVAKSADAARASASNNVKSVAKSADAARAAASKSSSNKSITKKTNTTSNPFTALHNKLSPYGDKTQKFDSGFKPLATRKSVPGKPSIGEQIHATLTFKNESLRANSGMKPTKKKK